MQVNHRPYNQMKTNPTCDQKKKEQSLFERLRRWIHGTTLQPCEWASTVDGHGDKTIVEQHCHRCWNYRHFNCLRWMAGRHPHRHRCWRPVDPGMADSCIKTRRLP